MPIEQILEKLKDDPGAIQEVKDWADKVSAFEKVKTAKAEIEAERDGLKAKVKELGDKVAEATKGGASNVEIATLKDELAKLRNEVDTSKAEAAKATSEKRATDLKNSVLGLEETAKRAANPNHLFALMLAENLVGYGEDGKAFYHRVNDKGEVVKAKNPAEAIDAFLKSNPHLEKSSGTSGSGQRPNPSGASGKFDPMAHI